MFALVQTLSILSQTTGATFRIRRFNGPYNYLSWTACIDNGRGRIRGVTIFGHRRISLSPGAGQLDRDLNNAFQTEDGCRDW